PRVRVSQAGYREQLDLTLAAMRALKRGMDASREIARQRDQRSGKGRDAVGDSLRALMGEDMGGLRAATGTLARLVSVLQEGGGARARGMKDAVRAYVAEGDGLIRRWRNVESMAVSEPEGR